MTKPARNLTGILERYEQGDPNALDALMPHVYDELRRLARRRLLGLSPRKTLSPTVLVHELFIKLKATVPMKIRDRDVFYRVASKCMRNLIVDLARRKKAAKRGGHAIRITVDEAVLPAQQAGVDIEVLNEALAELSILDAELARVVELRFLVGLSIEETAKALSISPVTVRRRWTTAKAWLQRRLS